MPSSFNKLRRLSLVAALWGTIAVAHAATAADCAAQADRASRSHTSVVGGAGRGALGGAVVGGIAGGGRSARRGAAVGAIVGGAVQAGRKNNTYQSVYDACMRGR